MVDYDLFYLFTCRVEFNFQKFTSIFVDYQDIDIYSSQFVGVEGGIIDAKIFTDLLIQIQKKVW